MDPVTLLVPPKIVNTPVVEDENDDDWDEDTLEPSVELEEVGPSEKELEKAFATVKAAIEVTGDVPPEIWQAFFEVKVFLSR